MRWLAFVLGAIAACGRIGFDPRSDTATTPDGDVPFTGLTHVVITDPTLEPSDELGFTVAISGDGNTIAASALGESSAATGINGNAADNSAPNAGAVYVFVRSGSAWVRQAYIKASNTGADDLFGQMLALSADGNTLVVGAYQEDSAATGVNGNDADNTATDAGAAYVYTRTGTTWSQQAYLKASNTDAGDNYGGKVAMSADGNAVLVGAVYEASSATGVGGNQTDDSMMMAGAAYVYTRAGTTWSQQAYIKATNTGARDDYGDSMCISADGATLAIASFAEDSAAMGVDGNQADNSAPDSGAVYVYTRSGTVWTPQAYLKASNSSSGDLFGNRICALSSDGTTLSVGASQENSAATGIDGDQQNNSATGAGAVYMFTRAGTTWSQQAYIKAPNTDVGDLFGFQSALSASGNTLFVGAPHEDSAAAGIDGDLTNNSLPDAGAAYLYTRSDGVWTYRAYLKALAPSGPGEFAFSLATSASGRTLVVGHPDTTNLTGAIDVYE
ncbi:MAG TPA: hypothetical protein VL326_04065 [Kofleriaceae bacterium]|nr:hypothetical protein [Kofleriaceae bacterium]